MNIVHIAQIEISRSGGMARVAWHWRDELERRGHRFFHVGRKPLGSDVHHALYQFAAWRAVRRMVPAPDLVLAHEPAAAIFAGSHRPLVAFSHGLERRGWEAAVKHETASGERIRLRSLISYPLWRLPICDYGMKRAAGALVLNRADYEYCLNRYGRSTESTYLFQNGVDAVRESPRDMSGAVSTVLFLGSWIARKGVHTLAQAAKLLLDRGLRPRWLLAGTGESAAIVMSAWPTPLRGDVEVIPSFPPEGEGDLFRRSAIFVLPSFFEGQPLALLQAMGAGLPVVVSDIVGHSDLVRNEETGLLFSVGDPAGLANQLARCLTEPELRQRLGASAERMLEGRTWEMAASGVADFIELIYRKASVASAGSSSSA